MLNVLELKKIIHDNGYLIEEINLFWRLLDNISNFFEDKDPILVLCETKLLGFTIDHSRNGECICGEKHLKFLFHCIYEETKFILGSTCVESLDKLKYLNNILEFTDEQKEVIHKLLSLYQQFQKLTKKVCIRPNCSNEINIKSKCNKKKVFQTFCGYCIISADNSSKPSYVKCFDCNEPVKFSFKNPRCSDCEKKHQGFRRCLNCSCFFKPKKNNYKNCFDCFEIKNKQYKERQKRLYPKHYIDDYF